MRTTPKLAILGMCSSLHLLCSCSTLNSNQPHLPADVAMNEDARRGGLLIVRLRLESGEKLPFILDTGCPDTVFDKSLEQKLGEPLGSLSGRAGFGYKFESGVYAAPRLWLGSTP